MLIHIDAKPQRETIDLDTAMSFIDSMGKTSAIQVLSQSNSVWYYGLDKTAMAQLRYARK
jgi:hypothetical protein